jgi:hypothetical protein
MFKFYEEYWMDNPMDCDAANIGKIHREGRHLKMLNCSAMTS